MIKKYIFIFIFLLISEDASSVEREELLKFIEILSSDITDVYIMEEKIPGILEQLNIVSSAIRKGDIKSRDELEQKLMEKLSKFDKHFLVSVRQMESIHSNDSDHIELSHESYWEMLGRKNSGIQRVELLDGNVGYLNFTGFDRLNPMSRKRVANAMAVLKGVNSVIIDLRSNGGGSPDMVALIAGYFFQKEMPLSSIYNREDNSTVRFESEYIRHKYRLDDVELFVLTSDDSFSAAEAFAYDMKHHQKATIVGQVTGGGANPIRYYSYPQGYEVAIPYAMAVNPVTKSNWEGVGVMPNVEIDAVLALDKAHCLALFSNQKKSKNKHLLYEIKNLILDKQCK